MRLCSRKINYTFPITVVNFVTVNNLSRQGQKNVMKKVRKKVQKCWKEAAQL